MKRLIKLSLLASAWAAAADPNPTWDEWIQARTDKSPSIEKRQISRAGRFQLMVGLGLAERGDFYGHRLLDLGLRYHLSESQGWEILRATREFSSPKSIAAEVQQKTGFVSDVRTSKLQVESSYVYSPVYGKYSWGSAQIVHFDAFALAGLGLRYAGEKQPYFQLGLGMNHFIYADHLSLLIEGKLRLYYESRSSKVFVREGILQTGLAWLF